MDYKKIILQIKLKKSLEVTANQLNEMNSFYLVLLKYKKKRSNFDVDLVMNKVYTAEIYAEFIVNYYKK